MVELEVFHQFWCQCFYANHSAIGISRAAPLAGQYARVIPLGPTVKVPLPVTLSGSSPAQERLLGASSWWGCST